jgi:hypothetical protein
MHWKNQQVTGERFAAVLDESEEVKLVSGLRLRGTFLHRESVIELCGDDPYKFAQQAWLD